MEKLSFVETGHALLEVGAGLLRRVYFYKSQLMELETAPLCVVDPALQEVQLVLLREYPEYSPRSPPKGVTNLHIFVEHADEIYDQLRPLRELCVDVIDFRKSADQALPIMLASVDQWHLEVGYLKMDAPNLTSPPLPTLIPLLPPSSP